MKPTEGRIDFKIPAINTKKKQQDVLISDYFEAEITTVKGSKSEKYTKVTRV